VTRTREQQARAAFLLARDSLEKLRTPTDDGSVYLNRFAEVEQVRFAAGTCPKHQVVVVLGSSVY